MRIACVQMDVVFGQPDANLKAILENLGQAKARGAELVVFPECVLTGYAVESIEAARDLAVSSDDSRIEQIFSAARDAEIGVVFGAAIRVGEEVRNRAFLSMGDQRWHYDKTHLPELGLDKFVELGEDLPVFDTPLGRIGILICFDLRPPEAARVLALKGADLILLPTNWPEGAEISAETISIVRAVENRVFLATCNRVGTEGGFTFIGRSKIISPTGEVLAAASASEAEIIVAEIDLEQARQKRIATVPGRYEWTVFESRRPQLYGSLVE